MSPIISDSSERARGWRNKDFEKKRINWLQHCILSVEEREGKEGIPVSGNHDVFGGEGRGTIFFVSFII